MAQLGNVKAAMGKTNLGGAASSSQGAKLSQNPHMMMAMTSGGSAYQPPGLQNPKANFHSQKKFLNQMGKVSTKNSQNPNTQGSQNRTGKLHNEVPSETFFFSCRRRQRQRGREEEVLAHARSRQGCPSCARRGIPDPVPADAEPKRKFPLSSHLYPTIRILHHFWLIRYLMF